MCSSSSVLTASLCLLLCLPPCLSPDETVTVKPGGDVTLQCHSNRDAKITMIKWTKPDLKSKLHVFYYRQNQSKENYQHPSYHDRVELKDKKKMKDGDVSLFLKNANTNDAGRYECVVGVTGSKPELINSIYLTVTDTGKLTKNMGLRIGLGVHLPAAALLVGVVVPFIFY